MDRKIQVMQARPVIPVIAIAIVNKVETKI